MNVVSICTKYEEREKKKNTVKQNCIYEKSYNYYYLSHLFSFNFYQVSMFSLLCQYTAYAQRIWPVTCRDKQKTTTSALIYVYLCVVIVFKSTSFLSAASLENVNTKLPF